MEVGILRIITDSKHVKLGSYVYYQHSFLRLDNPQVHVTMTDPPLVTTISIRPTQHLTQTHIPPHGTGNYV